MMPFSAGFWLNPETLPLSEPQPVLYTSSKCTSFPGRGSPVALFKSVGCLPVTGTERLPTKSQSDGNKALNSGDIRDIRDKPVILSVTLSATYLRLVVRPTPAKFSKDAVAFFPFFLNERCILPCSFTCSLKQHRIGSVV
jgi:hypothetical protein